MINIKGMDKARVLKALHDHSKAQGMSFLGLRANPLTVEECREMLKKQTYFDYLLGKVMKVDLSEDDCFEERLYDRDNGPGAAELAILDEFTRSEQCMKHIILQEPTDLFDLEIREEGRIMERPQEYEFIFLPVSIDVIAVNVWNPKGVITVHRLSTGKELCIGKQEE